MSTDKEFAEALSLARQAYSAEIAQGEAVAEPAFDAAAVAFSDRALAACALAQLRFNLRNSFLSLRLSEYHEAVLAFSTNESADHRPVYLALAKCTVALEASFSDVAEYEAAIETFRTSSSAGESMYPDIMEGLLDVAENREAIAAEIAESTDWLLNEVERRKGSP